MKEKKKSLSKEKQRICPSFTTIVVSRVNKSKNVDRKWEKEKVILIDFIRLSKMY